jgi:hypothetical protein
MPASAGIFLNLAGVEGLEPSDAGFRIQCLTNLAIPQLVRLRCCAQPERARILQHKFQKGKPFVQFSQFPGIFAFAPRRTLGALLHARGNGNFSSAPLQEITKCRMAIAPTAEICGVDQKRNACSVLKPLPPTCHPAQAATIAYNDSPCGAIPLRSIVALRKPSPHCPPRPPFVGCCAAGTMERSGIAPVHLPPGGR